MLLAVEASVLPVAAELTVTGLRAAVRRELLAHDPAAAERRRRAAADRADAAVRADPDAPGRADLVVGMSVEDAHACWATADALARAAQAAGDPRPLGVLRAEAVRDRILRSTSGDPPVTAQVTVIAPLDALHQAAAQTAHQQQPHRDDSPGASDRDPGSGSDSAGDGEPGGAGDGCGPGSAGVGGPAGGPDGDGDGGAGGGLGGDPGPAAAPGPETAATFTVSGRAGGRAAVGEVNGAPITATHLRQLLEAVDALCPGGLQPPAGGSLRYALTDPDGALRAVLTDHELRRAARRGCPHHGPGADCGCGLVDRPPQVDRYRPSNPQHQFIWTRDRRCRMPGCTTRAAWADLDHVIPHACGGATSCENLCCLCRRHHRLKTHAPGWTTRLHPDGTYTVTTPTGITATSRPPDMTTTAIARAIPPATAPARARTPAPAARAGPALPPRPPEDEPPPF